jgi:hypothetical protein
MSPASSKKTSYVFSKFIQSLPSAWSLPGTLEGSKNHTLPEPGKDPKFPQKLSPISLLSTTGKLSEKLTLRTIQKHTEERNLLNASQFGFRADHSTTLQCLRQAGHVALNFNNNMSTAAVFLDIEKAFDTTRYSACYINCEN